MRPERAFRLASRLGVALTAAEADAGRGSVRLEEDGVAVWCPRSDKPACAFERVARGNREFGGSLTPTAEVVVNEHRSRGTTDAMKRLLKRVDSDKGASGSVGRDAQRGAIRAGQLHGRMASSSAQFKDGAEKAGQFLVGNEMTGHYRVVAWVPVRSPDHPSLPIGIAAAALNQVALAVSRLNWRACAADQSSDQPCPPSGDVEAAAAEDLVRSAEPLRDAMERAGGLVDSWGGGEFCHILPRALAFIRSGAVGG